MRLAFLTAFVGCVLAYGGGVLALALLIGFLPALAAGLVVGGAGLVVFSEFVLAPRGKPVGARR
jgi:hypothetical protein